MKGYSLYSAMGRIVNGLVYEMLEECWTDELISERVKMCVGGRCGGE